MKKIALFLCAAALLAGAATAAKKAQSQTYSKTISGHNAPMTVSVTISNGKITDIDYSKNLETIGVGKKALETVAARIIDNQSLAVDVVTGASISSRSLIAAVRDCLVQSGADIKKWTQPKKAKQLKDETYDTDVLVIGGGGAGLAAAISAEQNGAKVIVMEKIGLLGGSTNVSEGALNAVDPKRQVPQGITDSVETFYNATMTGGHNTGTPSLVRYMTSNAYPAVEWLESIGVQFKDKVGSATGSLGQRSHYPKTPSGNSYIRVFEAYAAKHPNITVITDTKATSLIKKGDRVSGAVGENKGRKITVNASKGVIIATGGFGANVALRQKVNTGVWKEVKLDNSIGTTNMYLCAQGDGITLAESAGANVVGMPDIQLHPCGTPGTGLMENIRTSGKNRIFVNASGKRFVNENAARDTLCKAIFAQDGSTYWIVVNSVRYPSRDFVDNNGATIANMVAQGSVIEAATLDELAQKTKMNADDLKASVAQYNSVVSKEVEKDELGFTSNSPDDKTLDAGPWYACKKVPTVHHTMGGIQINTNAEVLGADGKPVPGLYACGEVTGGIHGSNRLGGNAIADCMVFGKTAGKSAASR
ncbi:flavocytochrome c [Treponema socranskii]|uniref:flavocytochrome c n=1 Tax=Treponema socranskii TaxID=53419 RepID=UPI003D94052D